MFENEAMLDFIKLRLQIHFRSQFKFIWHLWHSADYYLCIYTIQA